MKALETFFAAAAVAVAGTAASAATLNLEVAPADTYQNTVNSPCIISGTNCPQQPATFAYTNYNSNGGMSATTQSSPEYTVGQLLDMFANGFMVGVDINDTGKPQTLVSFSMLVGGAVVDTFTGSTGNVPALANGNGYADYLLTGLTDLSTYTRDTIVQFSMSLANMNDGPEKFFLVAATPAPVPLPAAGLMLLGGLGGLAAMRRRKQSA